jgi:hypothetical protein
MSKVTVINGEEETHLYKTELEHFAGDIYTTRVGLLSLRKLDFDIMQEED